jgi:hypothetical protein
MDRYHEANSRFSQFCERALKKKKRTLGLSAKAGALNLNTEIINRLPDAVMIYVSACTIVLDDPRHTVYYVCTYVQTMCGVTEQLKVNMIFFLFYEMFRSSPPKNDGF